jgi:hypothetical protein
VIDPAAADQAAAWDEGEDPAAAQLVTAGDPDSFSAPDDDRSGSSELWTEEAHVITQAAGEDFGAPADLLGEPDQEAQGARARAEAFPASGGGGGGAQTLRLRITTPDPKVPQQYRISLSSCMRPLPGVPGACRQRPCMSSPSRRSLRSALAEDRILPGLRSVTARMLSACQLAVSEHYACAQFVEQLGQSSMLGTLRDSLEAAEYQVSDLALLPEEQEVRPAASLRLLCSHR